MEYYPRLRLLERLRLLILGISSKATFIREATFIRDPRVHYYCTGMVKIPYIPFPPFHSHMPADFIVRVLKIILLRIVPPSFTTASATKIEIEKAVKKNCCFGIDFKIQT